MPNRRQNPVAIEVVGELAPRFEPQIEQIVQRVRETDQANHGWLQNQLGFIKARFGKRKKKRVPWAGASNVNVPLIDGIVRRWRPGITALILDADPVAFFAAQEESDLESAREVEKFFTWLFVEHMKTPPELMRLVDLIANRGHAYTREGWKWSRERLARVINVDTIFPEGIQEFVARASAQQPDQTSPVSLVANELAREYDLDPNIEEEGAQLLRAAEQLLSGAPNVKITYEITVDDRPDWAALDPLNVIVEQEGDPQEAEFVAVIHRMTRNQIAQAAKDGRFNPEAAGELLERMSSSNRTDLTQAASRGGAGGGSTRQQITDFMQRRAGINRAETMQSRTPKTDFFEIFCKLDLDGDGIEERAVLWYSSEFNIAMSLNEYVMPFRQWPITLFKFEPHSERPVDSRGIPELLSELQRLVNAFHNARVDAAQILLAPVMQRRTTAADYGSTVQWRPGAIIPVQQIGDIAPIEQNLNILTGLLQEEQSNQRIAETFIGTFDATINNLRQSSERRTAAEIQAITQLSTNVFGLDARLFQQSMGESFKKVWKLWLEFGPAEVFARLRGRPQPQLIRKSEIDMDFDITPAGTPSSTNRAAMLRNIEQILPIILQDQSGQFDARALLKVYFDLIDTNISRLVVRDEAQTAAAQTVIQGAQALSGNDALSF